MSGPAPILSRERREQRAKAPMGPRRRWGHVLSRVAAGAVALRNQRSVLQSHTDLETFKHRLFGRSRRQTVANHMQFAAPVRELALEWGVLNVPQRKHESVHIRQRDWC